MYGGIDVVYGVKHKESGKFVRGGNHYGYKSEGIAKSALTKVRAWGNSDWSESYEIVPLVEKKDADINAEAFSRLMYALTKDAARSSFIEYLAELEISEEDYCAISKHLHETYGVKTYV